MKIRKTIAISIVLSILAAFFSSCNSVIETPGSSLKFAQSEKPVKLIKIINHDAPNIQVDISPFTTTGCSPKGFADYRDMPEYDCKEGSPLYDLGCETMIYSPLLGGLNPNYPTVTCRVDEDSYPYNNGFVDGDLPSEGCIYKGNTESGIPCYSPITYKYKEGSDRDDLPEGGCMYSDSGGLIISCYFLVTYRENKYQLIDTIEEFRALFAPVDSPEEALGFVVANTNYLAKYGQTRDKNYAYFVQTLEDTHVEAIADGYLVHVFIPQDSSCSDPLNTEKSVEIKVTHNGYLSETNSFSVYSDPSLTGCE